MPKTHLTPREQLVCGKLDALTLAIQAGETIAALDLVELVRHSIEKWSEFRDGYDAWLGWLEVDRNQVGKGG